jgi:hypothetical protein
MPMIRVFFTGMCLNALHQNAQGALTKLDMILLTGVGSDGLGFRHSPMLTVASQQLEGGSAVDRTVVTRSRTTNETIQLGVVDMAWFDYRLEMTPLDPPQMSMEAKPIPASGQPTTGDWTSLEWVSDPSRATGKDLRVDPKALPSEELRHGSVAATFQLTHGKLAAAPPPTLQAKSSFKFYPSQVGGQAFTDTTVVEFSATPSDVTLVGEGFGNARGQTRRISLNHARDIDIHVSNLPALTTLAFDPTDFKPFYDVLLPRLTGSDRITHANQVGGELVYCMNARAKV